MAQSVWIVLGAAVGSLLRYKLQQQMLLMFGATALGTFLSNSLGCFVIGIVSSFFHFIPQQFKLLFVTGLLGSLTTLSSLQLETFQMVTSGRIALALFHWLGASVGGFVLCWLGYQIGQQFLN